MIISEMTHQLRCDVCGCYGMTVTGELIVKDAGVKDMDTLNSRKVLPRLASECGWLRLESRAWGGRDPVDICPMCAVCRLRELVKPLKPAAVGIVIP